MTIKRIGSLFAAVLLMTACAADGYAQISNAAVLFLRIAPGARAAGMGEAFVAVADDATTSHWNPAGLGAYPLADGWTEAKVPPEYRPLKAIAAIKQGGGSDYTAYEIWGISQSKGLVRFDNRQWHVGEKFSTRTDQTIRGLVAGYFRVQDEGMLDQMVARVARANAPMDRAALEQIRDSILAVVPEDYRDRAFLMERLDSLVAAYDEARVNWEYVGDARKNLAEGLKDGSISSGEADKINFAIERSKNRFIPEEIMIPYTVVFDGEPTAIAAQGRLLVVGTSEGLFTYDGKSWRTFTENEGLPSNDIRSLHAGGSIVYVGTAAGMVLFGGRDITSIESENLPEGAVSAIGSDGSSRVWTVIDGRLYHYNGKEWSGARTYTVAVGDTPEKIAERFTIYGTAAETEKFIAVMKELNPAGAIPAQEAALIAPELGEPLDITKIAEMAQAGSEDTAGAVAAVEPTAAETEETGSRHDWSNLAPGDMLYIPYAVGIKGNVNAIETRQSELFLGTDYGVLFYDGEQWRLPGWTEYTVGAGETVESIAAKRGAARVGTRVEAIRALNEIDGEQVDSGRVIRVPQNAVGGKINLIRQRGQQVYFATAEGLRVLAQGKLMTVNEKGMGNSNAIYIETVEDELWLASDEGIVIKANGRNEFSFMHVNWLPELANDMYYEFLSAVFQVGDIGTAGINVTYLTYGSLSRTSETGSDLGSFESYDFAISGAFGFSLTQRIKAGIGAKFIHSRLSEQGAGLEQGEGKSTGLALDLGLLYHWTPRLNLGVAITNLGPNMSYIDAAQSDPLPRNLAVGIAYKVLQSDYYTLLVTGEMNKLLVDVDFGEVGQELKEAIFNMGAEFTYAELIAGRIGYIYDNEGKVKTLTLGAGLRPVDWMQADFSYIPNSDGVALANTVRFSLSIMP